MVFCVFQLKNRNSIPLQASRTMLESHFDQRRIDSLRQAIMVCIGNSGRIIRVGGAERRDSESRHDRSDSREVLVIRKRQNR